MNKTAYLVLHIDTTKSPPEVAGAGVYSSRAACVTTELRKRQCHDVVHADGYNYDDARRELGAMLKQASPYYDWIRPLLRPDDLEGLNWK